MKQLQDQKKELEKRLQTANADITTKTDRIKALETENNTLRTSEIPAITKKLEDTQATLASTEQKRAHLEEQLKAKGRVEADNRCGLHDVVCDRADR